MPNIKKQTFVPVYCVCHTLCEVKQLELCTLLSHKVHKQRFSNLFTPVPAITMTPVPHGLALLFDCEQFLSLVHLIPAHSSIANWPHANECLGEDPSWASGERRNYRRGASKPQQAALLTWKGRQATAGTSTWPWLPSTGPRCYVAHCTLNMCAVLCCAVLCCAVLCCAALLCS